MTAKHNQRPALDTQKMAEAIPHLVWTARPDGAGTYLNAKGMQYTGSPRAANYGWNWVSQIHTEDAERATEAYKCAISTGTDYFDEFRIRRHDGVYRWHAFRASPVRDETGAIQMWIGTATDIENHKQLELSLRHEQEQAAQAVALLQAVGDAAPIGAKIVDRDMRIVRINGRLAHVTGRTPESLVGCTIAECVPDLWPQLGDVYRRAFDGETINNIEIAAPDRDRPGQSQYWLASYYPVRVNNEIVAVGNVVVDITERKETEKTLADNLSALVATVAATVEARDPYTAGHQRRVAEIAAAIAEELGVACKDVEGIRTAASIHDLGKISIPAEILSKPGRLSAAEFDLIKEHAETGYTILSGIEFPWPVAEMIRQHHERLDGSGYPRGLRGSEILLGARIIAVADIVEAMTAHRPYRPGYGTEVALKQLAHEQGALLDHDVVDACMRAFDAGRLAHVWD
jgi:PAS domain S-box-containing protein/putative nucleotidyltransferase with HDIG domain